MVTGSSWFLRGFAEPSAVCARAIVSDIPSAYPPQWCFCKTTSFMFLRPRLIRYNVVIWIRAHKCRTNPFLIAGNVMLPVFAQKWPADTKDDTIKQQHQEQFKFPVSLTTKQRSESLVYHFRLQRAINRVNHPACTASFRRVKMAG